MYAKKMITYLISFPNEHKQVSFKLSNGCKEKQNHNIYCKFFFHSGRRENVCLVRINKSKSTTVHRKYVRMGGDLHSYTGD
jgi:hypothetical protein